jgi:hypothetical protein
VIIDTSVFMGILPVRDATRVVAPTRHKPGESRWRWDQLSLGQNDFSAQFAPSVAVSDLLSIVHFMGLEASLLQHAENHTNTLVGDPAPRGLLGTDCTINGTYHDWPYCFGSDHPGGTRIGAPIQTRSAY